MLLAGTLAAAAAAAEEPASEPPLDPVALKRLSVEQLMEIDVTSVSKRSEPLSAAAAAITVITAEDIRRSGVTNLPDALRLATGLEVAQADGHTWAISARGFNATTANKLQVLIDGRSVYTPLFSGVFWDIQDTLLADVDRIEVIRGPGATLWGANAVNGVINIITKDAAHSQGGRVFAAGGPGEGALAGTRYGGTTDGGMAYRVYGKTTHQDALVLPSGASANDPLQRAQGGFRLDVGGGGGGGGGADSFTLQGDLNTGYYGDAVFGDSDLDGGNLLARWSRRSSDTSDWRLQAYVDYTHRSIPALFAEQRRTFDLDLQHHLLAGSRHELVWGLGYRVSGDRVENSAVIAFLPPRPTETLVNAFAQDEITLVPHRLQLTLGTKVEHNDYTGFELEPSARLAFTPSPTATLWSAVSRAVRSPTRFDTDLQFFSASHLVVAGSPDFRSESVVAYELGWRTAPRPGLTFDVATFYNVYRQLRSQEPSPQGLPFVLENKLDAETAGAELSANYQMTPRLRWTAGYTYLHERFHLEPDSQDPSGGSAEHDDPQQQWSLRASLDLPRRVELDAFLRHVGELPAPVVPAYTELDLRLGWEPVVGIELSLVGRNLLHARHPEFGFPGPLRQEVPRSVFGRIAWRF
ncbi:MAG TPA: TonB-dependent receptor [Thermoanaerobaculia bacterium]|nr:TonB-dependent receptor [Thermoanaerobaculia bacterium]